MKKYLTHLLGINFTLISLCLSLYSMDKLTERKSQEWDAAAYANGNQVQHTASLHFLTANNIDIKNKRILDVGCGTGNISAALAQHAHLVYGFDASLNMIDYAKKNYAPLHENLSFKQFNVEDFVSYDTYDLTTMFFCFHWFNDQLMALANIANSLKKGGELFATISTSDDPIVPHRAVGEKLIAQFSQSPNLSKSTITSQKLARTAPSLIQLKKMLSDVGFEIITCSLQTCSVILPNRTAYEKYRLPVMISRPFWKTLSESKRQDFFKQYIDETLATYNKTEYGEYIENVTITIVHARKK